MSKIHGTNVHILPDENLGGGPNGQVLREFVEVGRKPKDGELIINYGNNRIYKTKAFAGSVTFYDVETNEKYTGWADINGKLHYRTLEPTDIVRINDERYRLVDRKAKVGEKVIIVETHPCLVYTELGEIVEIIETDGDTCGGMFKPHDIGEKGAVYHFQYRVLEPVEPAQADSDLVTAEEGDPKSIIDLLANLAHRLTTLEQQVARRVTELEKRVIAIDEHNDVLIDRINDAEEKIEMILDDIVTLDERTQPLVTKKPSVAVAVKSIQQEFDGVFTKTEIDAYVAGEGFCLNGTFEFKGSVKGLNDAAEKISEVFK
jgi:hypothetical protein